jgi:hypothetical protein
MFKAFCLLVMSRLIQKYVEVRIFFPLAIIYFYQAINQFSQRGLYKYSAVYYRRVIFKFIQQNNNKPMKKDNSYLDKYFISGMVLLVLIVIVINILFNLN